MFLEPIVGRVDVSDSLVSPALQIRNKNSDIAPFLDRIDVCDIDILLEQPSFISLHARPVKGDFLLVELVLFEKQIFLDQENLTVFFEQRRKLEQLMRKDETCSFHDLFLLQRSLQYFTSSQFFSHFFLQENGLSHTGQIFSGKWLFFFTFSNFGSFVQTQLLLAFLPETEE